MALALLNATAGACVGKVGVGFERVLHSAGGGPTDCYGKARQSDRFGNAHELYGELDSG